MKRSKAIVLLSGGQDSMTCFHWALKKFDEVTALCFWYGQRHSVELLSAVALAEKHNVHHLLVQVDDAFNAVAVSSLLDGTPITTDGGLPSSYVPGRNIIFLGLAAAFAKSHGVENIVIGVNQEDYSGYPDCRKGFLEAMTEAVCLGVDMEITVQAPLMFKTKADIWEMADRLGIMDEIVEHSHTCYEGVRDTKHAWGYGCGKCPACVIRRDGFDEYQRRKGL